MLTNAAYSCKLNIRKAILDNKTRKILISSWTLWNIWWRLSLYTVKALSKEFVGYKMKFLEEQMKTLYRVSDQECVCWMKNKIPKKKVNLMWPI